MRRMLFGLLIVGGIATLIAGCGESGPEQPETVSVSGTVTLDGTPLAGALVTFATKEFSATAETDKDGKYTLPQGAVAGENLVFISKLSPGYDDPDEGMDAGQFEAANVDDPVAREKGQLVPEKYSDPEKSILKLTVPESGTDSASFKLTTTK